MHLMRLIMAVVFLSSLAAALVSCRIPVADVRHNAVHGAVQIENLLPNASFELPFGEEPRQPGNWGDILNDLTINLAATHQQPRNWPPRRVGVKAVEGNHAAQVTLDPSGDEFLGHLTSPVVPVRGGQVYTLSAYVRSEVPAAWVKLCFWTRPLDWRKPDSVPSVGSYLSFLGPDAESEGMEVSGNWKQYRFTFVVEHLVSQGVADLVIGGESSGKAWVDAVQLEEGPRASTFRTRYPVEAVLAGHRSPPNVHLVDEELELILTSYNSSGLVSREEMRLKIETLEGSGILEKHLQGPVPAGYREQKLRYPFQLVGEFRARVRSSSGAPIGLEDYLFVVHPVMHRDLQAVTFSRRGSLHQLQAERIWIPWKDNDDFFADPSPNLTVTRQGTIYAALKGGVVAVTRDGGRTWELIHSNKTLLSVLPDGTFLNATLEADGLTMYRSEDEGNTWTALGSIQVTNPQAGPVTQLKNGTLVWPIGHPRPGVPHTVYAYRSHDGGLTWSEGYPICPGGEPALIQLDMGRLLAVARHNPSRAPGEWEKFYRNESPWRLWQWATSYLDHHRNRLSSYEKNLLMADSDDGGITWKNPRAVTYLLDEMHGSAVQLPDGRIVLMYVHRVPALHGGERAKVSRDGGYTWEEELYYLNTVGAPNWEEVLTDLEKVDDGVFTFEESKQRSYPSSGQTLKGLWHINDHVSKPGYSASCILPPELADGKPGMILTIVGERKGKDLPARMQAIRWRPLSR